MHRAESNRKARPLDIGRQQRKTHKCPPLRFEFASTVPGGGRLVWCNARGHHPRLQRKASETTAAKEEEAEAEREEKKEEEEDEEEEEEEEEEDDDDDDDGDCDNDDYASDADDAPDNDEGG